MSGVAAIIDLSELERLRPRVESIFGPPDPALLALIGMELETQTKERFESKTSPGGAAWAAWSAAYAASGRGRELLNRDGHLLDSIQHLVGADQVEVGSNLEYARRQNSGFTGRGSAGRNVNQPAREFLGLTEANLDDIVGLVVDHYQARVDEGLGGSR